jgi:uncharacterized protein (TIGR00725 family)
MKQTLKIGVMGSASGDQLKSSEAREKAKALGTTIAERGYILLNGACPGLPDDALIAAREAGGLTIGISPAFSAYEHVNEYKSPMTPEIIMYTGQGFMERDIVNIRSSDALVFVGGGVGTINEFTIAYNEGKPCGILTGTGGMADNVPHIIEDICSREMTPNVVLHDDPEKLMDLLELVLDSYPIPIHADERVKHWGKDEGIRG